MSLSATACGRRLRVLRMRFSPTLLESLRNRRALRIAGAVVGLACLVAAVFMAMRERDEFTAAFNALRNPPLWEVGCVLSAVAAGLVLTALLFQLLLRRYAVVGFGEMFTLMSASTLANYLPLKPGFLGRVAYHRVRHGVRPTDTVRTIFEAIALSATVAAMFLGSLALLRVCGARGEFSLLAPGAVTLIAFATGSRSIALALTVRHAEFALLTLRYWIVFRLIGAPIEFEAAIVLASVNAIATLIPFISSGLGVREWLTGLITPLVSPDTFSQGIIAELVHRVAEIAVIAPLGTLSLALLTARVRRDAKRPLTPA